MRPGAGQLRAAPAATGLRDLTRQRANLVRDRTQVLNRLQKILEDANVKLAAVVSDINGVSALDMLRHLVAGTTDAAQLAGLARAGLFGIWPYRGRHDHAAPAGWQPPATALPLAR